MQLCEKARIWIQIGANFKIRIQIQHIWIHNAVKINICYFVLQIVLKKQLVDEVQIFAETDPQIMWIQILLFNSKLPVRIWFRKPFIIDKYLNDFEV